MGWYILALVVCLAMLTMTALVQGRSTRERSRSADETDAAGAVLPQESAPAKATALAASMAAEKVTVPAAAPVVATSPAAATPVAAAPTAAPAPTVGEAPSAAAQPAPATAAPREGERPTPEARLDRSLPEWRGLLAPLRQVPGVIGWAVLTQEGLIYDAELKPEVKAAVEALGLTNAAGQATELLKLGPWQKLTLESNGGLVMVLPLAAGLVLLVVASPETSLGLLRYQLGRMKDGFYLEA